MDEDEPVNLGLDHMSLTALPPGTPQRDEKEKNRSQIVTISESIASPGPSPQEPSPRSVVRQPPFFEGEAFSGSLDWTSPSSAATEFSAHIKLAQSIEWEKTPLGPLSSWSPQLRQMANLVMIDPGPAILFWGPSLNVIYNEHYILLAGQNHPKLMGAEPYSIFPDAAQHFDRIFEECRHTGHAIRQVDVNMFFDRHGYLEEAFFTFDMLPVLGSDGKVVGFFEPVRETTKEKLAERRLATLLGLSQLTADATSLKEYFGRIIQGLAVNSRDSPFALLYSVNEAVERLSESAGLIIERCGLEGAIGVPEGHLCAPPDLDVFNSSQGFAPAFRQVLKERQAVHIQRGDREFPRGLIEGIEWRGFKEPCREVVVLPIYPTASRKILAFLVLGINPRRAYDEPYRKYIQLLERQLSSSVAGIVLLEEEMRRSQLTAQIAAADRDELLTRVEEMEMRFKRMAEHAPVGMFNYSADGRLLWANATWYEITGHPDNTKESLPFIDLVCGEDAPFVAVEWSKLMRDENLIRYEIRLKKPWTKQIPGSDRIFQGTTWVLASAYSEKDDDGAIKSIMGTITDISEQKWAEGVQDGRRKEAEELKRQQENFIDMVSHEMRNPLSAIIQSSDGIISSLSSTKLMSDPKIVRELCDVEDSVETILQCAQHQKRIIDDILTLSKLDSELLNIIPMSIQPLTIVQRALKMFSSECQANEIEAVLVVKNSFNKLKVDWVMLDPGRLLQVLVNLITNAIKITIPENERRITLSIGASQKRPIQNEHNINYLPTKLSRIDSDLEPPEGADFFLKFAVTDTGAGLTEAESQKLFKRFSQALPRTHVQYSGSGLGLFISRELTEMQGGEIGFKSEPGKGSTFAFYIKVTPSQPPKRDLSIKRANSVAFGMSHTDPDFMARLAAGKVLQNPSRATTDPGVRESGEGDKPNVLIVEDNLVNQKVLSKQLKQKYTVHVANHGEEALAFLQNTTFWADARSFPTKSGFEERAKDIYMVLMDLEMPVMDGLTCIRRIRELQKEGKIHGHVPVIAVTANARKEQIDSALGAGMDDVMCKPFRINDLVDKMADVKNRVSQVEYQSD